MEDTCIQIASAATLLHTDHVQAITNRHRVAQARSADSASRLRAQDHRSVAQSLSWPFHHLWGVSCNHLHVQPDVQPFNFRKTAALRLCRKGQWKPHAVRCQFSPAIAARLLPCGKCSIHRCPPEGNLASSPINCPGGHLHCRCGILLPAFRA